MDLPQQVRFLFHSMHKQGFTLIELIIYIAISSIVLLGTLQYGFILLDDQIKYQALADVQFDHQRSMELIVDHVHRAAFIGAGTVYNTQNGTLELGYINAPTTTFVIVQQEVQIGVATTSIGRLQVTRSGSSPSVLTADDVTVTNFKLTDLSSTTTPVIYLDMTIEALNIAGDPKYDASHSWGTTAIIRAR
jgi:prepilin-type N-terminal cleavage/methylation domain-containing protein